MSTHTANHKHIQKQYHVRLLGFLISVLGIILFGIVILGISLYGLDKPTTSSNQPVAQPEVYILDPGKTSLSLELRSSGLTVGQQATLAVNLNAVAPAKAATVVLKYNPDTVTMQDAADLGVFAKMTDSNDSTGGYYRINFMPSIDASTKTVQGSHTITTIHFIPKTKTDSEITVLCGAAGQSVVTNERQQLLSCEPGVTTNSLSLANIADAQQGSNPTPIPTPNPGSGNPDLHSVGGPSNDPSCHETAPSVKPSGLQAWSGAKRGIVNLAWSKVDGADHYTITYGEKWMDFRYGVPNTGDTNAFEVGNLVPGRLYYFVVTANRGCATTGYSDGASAKAGWGPQIYIAPKTTAWTTQVKATPRPTIEPQPTLEPTPMPTLEPTPEPTLAPVTDVSEDPQTPLFLRLLPWIGLVLLVILAVILVRILRQSKEDDPLDGVQLPKNLFADEQNVRFNSKDPDQ